MKEIDVSIIIVSFNTKDLTVECLKSLAKTIKKSTYEVIVVDNNSSDGTAETISELTRSETSGQATENLKLIENKENLGFSKANNIGVKEATGRYILFLNSDTVVYDATIDGMIDFMDDHEDVGASTCFLRLPNGKLDDAAHRGFPTPARAFSHFTGLSKIIPIEPFSGYNLKHLKLDVAHEIDALAGAFMLVRRRAGEDVGWWDEDYFFYGEDIDFCYKLKEKKWKIYFVPEFEILHYKGVSGGIKKHTRHLTSANDDTRERAKEERFKAMRIFYNKHYKDKYPALVRYMVLLGIEAKKHIS